MMDFNAISAGLNLIAGSGCLVVATLVWVRRKGVPNGYGGIAVILGLIFFAGGIERTLLFIERMLGDIVNPVITPMFVFAVICRLIFAFTVWAVAVWLMFYDVDVVTR